MSTMICGRCGRFGIAWRNLTSLSPYTECPHCGGINCQEPEKLEEEQEEDESVIGRDEYLRHGGICSDDSEWGGE